MSSIRFTCPHCNAVLESSARDAGRWIECPSCGQRFATTRSQNKKSHRKSGSAFPVLMVSAVVLACGAMIFGYLYYGQPAQRNEAGSVPGVKQKEEPADAAPAPENGRETVALDRAESVPETGKPTRDRKRNRVDVAADSSEDELRSPGNRPRRLTASRPDSGRRQRPTRTVCASASSRRTRRTFWRVSTPTCSGAVGSPATGNI